MKKECKQQFYSVVKKSNIILYFFTGNAKMRPPAKKRWIDVCLFFYLALSLCLCVIWPKFDQNFWLGSSDHYTCPNLSKWKVKSDFMKKIGIFITVLFSHFDRTSFTSTKSMWKKERKNKILNIVFQKSNDGHDHGGKLQNFTVSFHNYAWICGVCVCVCVCVTNSKVYTVWPPTDIIPVCLSFYLPLCM